MNRNNYFSAPDEYAEDLKNFEAFLDADLRPHVSKWYDEGAVPRSFFQDMAGNEWLGFDTNGTHFLEQSSLKQTILVESLSKLSPGVAVAFGAHTSLGTKGLLLFGNQKQKGVYLDSALQGNTLMCLGNTELTAGSDVANVGCQAGKVDGGWLLNGSKAYVTNGAISDLALITAVSDPEENRNKTQPGRFVCRHIQPAFHACLLVRLYNNADNGFCGNTASTSGRVVYAGGLWRCLGLAFPSCAGIDESLLLVRAPLYWSAQPQSF